jgi:hypothetical protein
MWIWIFAIIAGLIIYVIFSIINKTLSKAIAPKTPTLSTSLDMFKESGSIDTRVAQHGLKVVENISLRYERMCIIDPVKYANDPSLPEVIEQYGKLLRGEIKDPEGRHMPSEMINGARNYDYERYVKAQKKGSKGLVRECRRLKMVNAEEDLRTDFILKLTEMGLPVEVLNSALSDEKLNKFSTEDWKILVTKVKEYLSEYRAEAVAEFLENFHDIKILTDEEAMESFTLFRTHDAPMPVVVEIVRGRITVDQGVRIVNLVVVEEYSWAEALDEVLKEDHKAARAEELRDKYRAAVR